MSIELNLIQVFCSDREKCILHRRHVDGLENLERELKIVFNLIASYYDEYEDQETVDQDTLIDYFELKHPKASNKEEIVALLYRAFNLEVNMPMLDTLLDQLHEKHTAGKIVNSLLPVMEGEKYGVLSGLGVQIEDYTDQMHIKPLELERPVPCEESFRELMEEDLANPGLNWRLPGVTKQLEGLKPSTLGLIYAYIGNGKTSFMLDNVACWADQLGEDENICYCGNEELHKRLKKRSAQAFLKKSNEWMRENIDEGEMLLKDTGFNKVKYFKDIVAGEQITYILKKYHPRILIIDQGAYVDIKVKRRAEGVGYLEQLFQWYRRLANSNELAVICIAQGVGTAENEKWLKLSDIYGSKVAIQGALDWAMGIGRLIKDPALENMRYLHFTKTKNSNEGSRLTTKFQRVNCEWKEA